MRKHLLWISPLLLLVSGLTVAAVLLIHWITGGACQALIEQKTAEALHVKTKMGPLSWQWFGIASPQLHATGSETTTLKNLEAFSLQAQLKPTSLLQGVWGVEEIAMEKMTLHLGSAPQQEIVTEVAASPAPALPKWIPSLLIIDVIRSKKADMLIDLPHGKSIEILNTALEARPDKDQTRFAAHGGTLKSPFLPDLKVSQAHALLNKKEVILTGSDLLFSDGGTLHLEGSFPFGDHLQKLQGHWENISLPVLLPLISGKVVGTLEGEGTITWEPDSLKSLEGTVSAHEVTLTNLPVLEKIAAVTGIRQFRHLPVQEAHASFSRSGAITTWHNVILESKGFLKLMGDATATDTGNLEGTFQLGITSSIVSLIPGASAILGLNEHDGYIWMPLHVGGTLSHPTQDFTPKLGLDVTAVAGGLIRDGLNVIGVNTTPTAPSQGSSTTTPATNSSLPSTAIDAATNAVKTLEKGAGSAIDTLGGFFK